MNVNRRIVFLAWVALGAFWTGCSDNPCADLHEAIGKAQAAKGCKAVVAPYVKEVAVDPDHCPGDRPSEERISCEATVFMELTNCSDPMQVTKFQADLVLCQSADVKSLTGGSRFSSSGE